MYNLRDYGYLAGETAFSDDLAPARVIAVHRERYELVSENGPIFGRLKSGVYRDAEDVPTVGDFVLVRPNPYGDSNIVETLPRKSSFYRKDPGPIPIKQMVAANFDFVFIISSLNRDFNPRRISRYLTMASQSGGTPVVLLTKADLCESWDAQVEAVRKIAEGTDVIALSSVTGQGLERLDEYLEPGKTVVFLGMSGVGKSSLLNALAGQELMAVNEIREDDSRGRHTTTHRQLVMLPSGTMVIDTPGMRVLGLWDADEGIGVAFSDVEDLFPRCRFSDCGHTSEPGCAVLAALSDGSLSQDQWRNYLTQKREAAFIEDKARYLRERTKQHKSISKQVKKQGKDRRKY